MKKFITQLCIMLLIQLTVTINIQADNGTKSITKLDSNELKDRIDSDIKSITRYRNGIKKIIAYVNKKDDIFLKEKQRKTKVLNREQKMILWRTWQGLLDYFMALDSIKQYHANYFLLKEMKSESFRCYFTSFITEYKNALEFLQIAENDPNFDVMLNESVYELGLPKGTYKNFKFRFLNVAMATEFAALNTVYEYYKKDYDSRVKKELQNDIDFVFSMGKGKGVQMTFENAFNIIKNITSTAIFPVQAGVSEWMGDTKVWRLKQSLITDEQIKSMQKQLLPGDILLERREWYLSNVGLPGYWPHAALYIGTQDERKKYFGEDKEIIAWVQEQGEKSGNFDNLLKSKYPKAYASAISSENNHSIRIVEAVSEGVIFSTLEHSASSDSLAVLRPRLSKVEIARAIITAFHLYGRPYDFNFDFLTDSAIVCTELVYKAYEPSKKYKGLKFQLVQLIGRNVLPANEIVHQFDLQYNTAAQQTDLVLFYDGHEKNNKAIKSTLKEFRKSWTRPKWHIFVQKKLK